MKKLQENETLTNILINQFVNDEMLYNMINEEDSIPKLSCLLQLFYQRITRNLAEKRNFSVVKILNNECSFNLKKTVLYFALHIQADNTELKNCLYLFNEKLTMMYSQDKWQDDNNLLLCIASVILEFNIQLNEDLFIHMDNLKMFLLKMCGMNFSKDISIDRVSLFFKYFEIIITEDFKFVDETIQYFLEQGNLNFLCLLFDKKLSNLVLSNFFQKDDIWNSLKSYVVCDSNMKKKQGQYILWKTIQYFKTNMTLIPNALQMQSIKDWDFFFIILEMSREKQLHLILPTLKLLPSVTNLHITWQICLYRELLNHSQLTVVYNMIEHILQLNFTADKIHQELLHLILVALNKFEYSDLSKNLFRNLEMFCSNLTEDCCSIFFEEFSSICWNPAAAWCVLTSASPILHKTPQHFIIQILQCLKKLPHLYIKQGCIIFFLNKLMDNSTNIAEKFLIIGNLLLLTGQDMYKEIFYQMVDERRFELEKCNDFFTEMVMKSIREKNTEYVIIHLELMKKLNMEIDFKLEMSHSKIDDIIIFYFPNLFNHLEIMAYVLQRLHNENDEDYRYLLKFLEMSFDNDLANVTSTDCLDIWNLAQISENKRLIASYLIYRIAEVDDFSIDLRLVQQAETNLEHTTSEICKLWFKRFRKSFKLNPTEVKFNELIQKFLDLLDIDDDNILKIIVDNLELITKYSTFEKSESLKILDICLKKLCKLSSNLTRTYGIVFLKSIFELNLFSQPSFAGCWKNWYLEFFDCYFMESECLMKVILEGCRKIILLEAPYSSILTPLVLSAITRGTIIQKNQRVEYGICQEIHNRLGPRFIQNPNLMVMDSKMLSIECLYLLAKNKSLKNSPSADSLVEMLLDLYMQNYKKRYFPDSKIHLEKLRIVQTMLMLVHFTDRTKEKLVQFILNSFCEESHQPSVKQLLQWLLIILVSKSSGYLSFIINKVDTASLLHPSSVVALIPVLYHLVTSLNEEEYWCQVTDALLPWTMGANFKLRVYSQVILRNILRVAKQKQHAKYIEKYSYLENSISTVIDATGHAVTETLKNDINFIENFDSNLHYSVENIFMALPRMLHVPPYEWENVLEYKFSEKFDVVIKSVHKLPSKIVTENYNDTENSNEFKSANVQKKIIPWKQDMEEKIESKSLNSLVLVASLVEKLSNIGGLSRTCEIFNVKQLVLHNIKIKDDKEFKNLSMSSENWIDFMEVKKDDLLNFMFELKEQGYSIVGLEQTSESVKLDQFKFKKKTAILLGNEREGIPAPLLPMLDTCIEIPQFGQTRSLNVHVAGATCIWEYVKQHLL